MCFNIHDIWGWRLVGLFLSRPSPVSKSFGRMPEVLENDDDCWLTSSQQ